MGNAHSLPSVGCPGPDRSYLSGSRHVRRARIRVHERTARCNLLRYFNQPGGAAETMADQIAGDAVSQAANLTRDVIVDRFIACARRVRDFRLPGNTVARYPIIGTTTVAAISEVALMEATVHLLDLADAVGGVEPSAEALAATRDLLVAVPDPKAVVEVLAGRAEPVGALPAIR
jgi:hypothetical protein